MRYSTVICKKIIPQTFRILQLKEEEHRTLLRKFWCLFCICWY